MIGDMEEISEPGELMASTYPRIVLACIMIFSAILLVNPKRAGHDRAHFPVRGLLVVVVTATYIVLLDVVGYFILTPILLIVLPLLAGFQHYAQILLSVLVVTASLYGVFSVVLNIPLPAGFLGG